MSDKYIIIKEFEYEDIKYTLGDLVSIDVFKDYDYFLYNLLNTYLISCNLKSYFIASYNQELDKISKAIINIESLITYNEDLSLYTVDTSTGNVYPRALDSERLIESYIVLKGNTNKALTKLRLLLDDYITLIDILESV